MSSVPDSATTSTTGGTIFSPTGKHQRHSGLTLKVAATFSLVLLAVTVGMAILSRSQMEKRHERERQHRWQEYGRALHVLLQHRYDELQHIARLASMTHENHERMEEHLRITLADYSAASGPAWPLEAALFCDSDGHQHFSWHEQPEVITPLARTALSLREPVNVVLCRPVCRQYSAIPLLRHGSVQGALVLGRSLADVLQDFTRVSGLDAALLLPQRPEQTTAGQQRPLPGWSGRVPLLTGGQGTYAVLQAAARLYPLPLLRQHSVQMPLLQRHYELQAFPLQGQLQEDEASLILLQDITDEKEAQEQAWRQNLSLGLAGSALAEALLLTLLWGPVGRLRLLAESLPLLAQGQHALLRTRLSPRKRGSPRDETDRLMDTVCALSLELERLQEEVQVRTAALEQSNETLLLANSELAERQRELDQARQQLVQSESVAALGRIAAGMAHEINNALNYTAGALPPLERVLLQALEEQPRTEGSSGSASILRARGALLLHNMRTGVQRIAAMVSDLSTFARPPTVQREPVDLAREIEVALALVEPTCQGRITVIRRLPSLPPLLAHRGQLGQLLLNLLTNAVEAIEDRGIIAVAAWMAGDRLLLRVSDSGQGIAEEALERVFDPSFSTKGRGSGMGLALCHSIVRQHGGEIRVTSVPGQGSSFEVSLPLDASMSGTASA